MTMPAHEEGKIQQTYVIVVVPKIKLRNCKQSFEGVSSWSDGFGSNGGGSPKKRTPTEKDIVVGCHGGRMVGREV